jgi:hypothetical protein
MFTKVIFSKVWYLFSVCIDVWTEVMHTKRILRVCILATKKIIGNFRSRTDSGTTTISSSDVITYCGLVTSYSLSQSVNGRKSLFAGTIHVCDKRIENLIHIRDQRNDRKWLKPRRDIWECCPAFDMDFYAFVVCLCTLVSTRSGLVHHGEFPYSASWNWFIFLGLLIGLPSLELVYLIIR